MPVFGICQIYGKFAKFVVNLSNPQVVKKTCQVLRFCWSLLKLSARVLRWGCGEGRPQGACQQGRGQRGEGCAGQRLNASRGLLALRVKTRRIDFCAANTTYVISCFLSRHKVHKKGGMNACDCLAASHGGAVRGSRDEGCRLSFHQSGLCGLKKYPTVDPQPKADLTAVLHGQEVLFKRGQLSSPTIKAVHMGGKFFFPLRTIL